MKVRPTMPTRKVRDSLLQQHSLSEQSHFSKLFTCLHIGKTLRQVGIFSLVFEGKNWFRLLESDRAADLPGKDVI